MPGFSTLAARRSTNPPRPAVMNAVCTSHWGTRVGGSSSETAAARSPRRTERTPLLQSCLKRDRRYGSALRAHKAESAVAADGSDCSKRQHWDSDDDANETAIDQLRSTAISTIIGNILLYMSAGVMILATTAMIVFLEGMIVAGPHHAFRKVMCLFGSLGLGGIFVLCFTYDLYKSHVSGKTYRRALWEALIENERPLLGIGGILAVVLAIQHISEHV